MTTRRPARPLPTAADVRRLQLSLAAAHAELAALRRELVTALEAERAAHAVTRAVAYRQAREIAALLEGRTG